MQAIGVQIDEAKVKSLIESIKNINIDEVIKSASTQVPVVQTTQTTQTTEEKAKEEKKEKKEEKASEEQAVAGLGALFGL